MAPSSIASSARLRLNRAWYLGTFVLCSLIGAVSVLSLVVVTLNQPATDGTLSVPTDELAMGVLALVVWLGVLAAVGWWAFRSYRRLARAAEGERSARRG
jgi:hypothetical protein